MRIKKTGLRLANTSTASPTLPRSITPLAESSTSVTSSSGSLNGLSTNAESPSSSPDSPTTWSTARSATPTRKRQSGSPIKPNAKKLCLKRSGERHARSHDALDDSEVNHPSKCSATTVSAAARDAGTWVHAYEGHFNFRMVKIADSLRVVRYRCPCSPKVPQLESWEGKGMLTDGLGDPDVDWQSSNRVVHASGVPPPTDPRTLSERGLRLRDQRPKPGQITTGQTKSEWTISAVGNDPIRNELTTKSRLVLKRRSSATRG